MRVVFLLIICAIALAISCSKPPGTEPDPDPPVLPKDTTSQNPANPPAEPPDKGVVVYISGDSFNTTTAYLPYPIYWKNGKQVHLPHPGHAGGSGIALSDNDVFVSCSGEFAGNNVTYWKNTTAVNLADASIIYPAMRDIVIAGGNLYTLGIAYINNFEKIVPVYWKNQDPVVKLSTYSSSASDAQSIAVYGNDIYITGSTVNPQPQSGYTTTACYWKNGIPIFLQSLSASNENGLAKSLKMVGSDVHVVGDAYRPGMGVQVGTAYHWKNGTPIPLTGTDSFSYANDLAIEGTDVYIAGAVAGPDKIFHAAYWKNGILKVLDPIISEANGISVFEGDVYVVGNRSIDLAIVWKNNAATVLGRGRARAIAVKRY
ncbi:MAG: hypothetical protein ACTHMV_15415 [Chitinophagaceae bacterium]